MPNSVIFVRIGRVLVSKSVVRLSWSTDAVYFSFLIFVENKFLSV